MKLWYSAAELAALALPGLPERQESIIRFAERSGWNRDRRLARPRGGRGGGMEYRIELLPIEARMALLARFVEPGAGEIETSAAPDAGPVQTSAAQDERDARLHMVGLFKAWHRQVGLGTYTAVAAFAELYEAGGVKAPQWVKARIGSLSGRTLWRWLKAAREGEVDRLGVDRGATRRGKGVMEEAEGGALLQKVLVLHAHNPHLSPRHLRGTCCDAFGDSVEYRGKRVPMPTLRAFQALLKKLKTTHKAELLALHNPDAFKSRMRVSGSSAHLVTRVNAEWQIDASPGDVMCIDGRKTIYVCTDVFSRRSLGYVSATPRAAAVGMLMKKALLAWGVPERVKTDNGSDFAARATQRLLADLKIEVVPCPPYSPEKKGVVERAIKTMQHDFMPPLPGFIGHCVEDRKAIENRKSFLQRLGQKDAEAFRVDLTSAELAQRLDAWFANEYDHRDHGGIGQMTPFAKAQSCMHPLRRIENEAAIAVLLAPVAGKDGIRTVGKMGLRIDGSHYIVPGVMPGEQVMVRMDPADMGRAFVFAEDGETFRAIALCPELAGIDPVAALAAAQAAQKAYIKDRLAPIRREAAKIKPRDIADALAREAAKNAGKLTAFPKRAQIHTTPALDGAAETGAALDVLRGKRAPAVRPMSAAEAAMMAKLEAETAPANGAAPASPVVTPLRQAETPHQKYRRARALEERIALGQPVDTEDAIWLGGYQQTAEYRSTKYMVEDFGEAALR